MGTRTVRRAGARILLCVLVPAALLAACGSSAPASRPVTVTRTVTRTTDTPSTTATTSTPTTTSTPPQPAADRCVAADLSLSFLGGNGATGHVLLGFALRNTSSHSCRTGGYPGVLFLDAAGHGLPTHPEHTTTDFAGHTTLQELTVAAGASVSFRLVSTDIGSGGSNAGCVRATALQVIAPDDTATMRVALRGGVIECDGKVTVSPILAGADPSAG